MRAGVDHIIVNVNDNAAAKKFYSWLMPQIGYPQAMSYEQPDTDVTSATSATRILWIRTVRSGIPRRQVTSPSGWTVRDCIRSRQPRAHRRSRETDSGQRWQGHRSAEGVRLPAGILRGVFHRSRRPEAGTGARPALSARNCLDECSDCAPREHDAGRRDRNSG